MRFAAMKPKSAIVVGAGFAGLSAALELGRAGVQVTVLEALSSAGGRAQRRTENGYTFDLGPTLIVMTDVLKRTLGDESFARLALSRIEPGYEIRWPDGQRFALHSDIALLVAEFARFEGPMRASHALRYLADVHEAFTDAQSRILERDHTVASFLRTIITPGRMRPWIFGNLRAFTQRYFTHPRTVEALTFQSLYLGTSPLRAPALYALLPVSEAVGGVWYAPGGTGAIVAACVDACKQLGVRFVFNARVDRIDATNKGVSIFADDERYDADAVVVTADREPAMRQLFGAQAPPRERRMRYGHSAAVWYVGVRRAIDLPHHTVFLPQNPWQAYAALDAGRQLDDPMVYVCNPRVSDATVAPAGHSALLVLTPVPNRSNGPELDTHALRERVLQRLEREVGPLRDAIAVERFRGPKEFAEELGLLHGAAFGPDHTLDQMTAFRPSIAHPHYRNVVFAGSGTRPGSGVPMVLISGRLAAQRLLQ